LIYDVENFKELKKILGSDYDLLLNGRNPKYWDGLKDLNRDRYNYQRGKFKDIVLKYGKKYQTIVLDLIKNEWDRLFINSTNLPIGESVELRNLTLKIKGKKVRSVNNFCKPCQYSQSLVVNNS
jgi:hypothetical protein